jgi:hypothetical protein
MVRETRRNATRWEWVSARTGARRTTAVRARRTPAHTHLLSRRLMERLLLPLQAVVFHDQLRRHLLLRTERASELETQALDLDVRVVLNCLTCHFERGGDFLRRRREARQLRFLRTDLPLISGGWRSDRGGLSRAALR